VTVEENVILKYPVEVSIKRTIGLFPRSAQRGARLTAYDALERSFREVGRRTSLRSAALLEQRKMKRVYPTGNLSAALLSEDNYRIVKKGDRSIGLEWGIRTHLDAKTQSSNGRTDRYVVGYWAAQEFGSVRNKRFLGGHFLPGQTPPVKEGGAQKFIEVRGDGTEGNPRFDVLVQKPIRPGYFMRDAVDNEIGGVQARRAKQTVERYILDSMGVSVRFS